MTTELDLIRGTLKQLENHEDRIQALTADIILLRKRVKELEGKGDHRGLYNFAHVVTTPTTGTGGGTTTTTTRDDDKAYCPVCETWMSKKELNLHFNDCKMTGLDDFIAKQTEEHERIMKLCDEIRCICTLGLDFSYKKEIHEKAIEIQSLCFISGD